MLSLYQLTTQPHECSYLPDQESILHYCYVARATPEDYQRLLWRGWRRFGRTFFHPVCENCRACQSLRVPAEEFRPDRSQRRAWKTNLDVEVRIGPPQVDEARLQLHARYHDFQADHVGWERHPPKDEVSYAESFLDNPFPTEEWTYFLNDALIGVSYVDILPEGLSAIYFFHDPDLRHRSLGTFNVLLAIEQARRRGLPYVYLGYYVRDCRSLEYKARFCPNEVLSPSRDWVPFRSR